MRTKEQRKRHVQYLARTVQPIGEWGHGPGRGHKAPKTHRKPKVKGSGGQKYLVARIARDRPDVLERMKQGEFISVRQAAIAAGIVRNGTDQVSSRKAREEPQTPPDITEPAG
jgi:hypothetical protein